jgi:hypothetical protein
MGGRSSKPRAPVAPSWRGIIFASAVKKAIPYRVVSRPISKLDKRQQWQIILNKDKKTFTLKNVETNTYLYITKEPTEGLSEYTTIDIDNQNYKYDPAFVNISEYEINIATNFSFISSFGTQLDIIDKNNEANINSNILKSIKGTRIRLTTQNNQYLNIFGVFIYSPEGNIINTNPAWAYSSSNYENHPASNAIKIVTENPNRKGFNAIQNTNLNNKNIGWNNWNQSSSYCAHTKNDNTGVGGGDWWEYEFTDLVDMSLIEIFGRIDCCPERNKNLRIDIFDDKKSRTKVIWTGSFGNVNNEAHKSIKLI